MGLQSITIGGSPPLFHLLILSFFSINTTTTILIIEAIGYLWLLESNKCPFGVGEYGEWYNTLVWVSGVYVAKGIID